MKAKIFVLITLLLMLTTSSLAADTSVIKATLLRYEPTPAVPGEYVTVYVQLENIGTADADNVRIIFKDNYPFSADDPNERQKDLGVLKTSQAYVTDFKIRVDNDAIEGSSEIKFEFTDNFLSNDDFTEKVFNVNVQTQDADISIESVDFTPEKVMPGETTKIGIELKNNADSNIKDISLQLVLFTTIGTTVIDIPFAVKDSVTEKTKEQLSRGETTIFEYNLISYPSIEPGIYKIPTILEYFDGTGTKYTKEDFITIVISPKINLDLLIDSSSVSKETMRGEISLRVINRGFGDIKFASIKVVENSDFEILDTFDSTYLGNIDSDDYETADFNIKAKKSEIVIPVELEYVDSLNKEYTIQKSLSLDLAGQATNGKSGPSMISMAFWGIVIVAAGFWFYKRRQKKKKH